MITSDFHLHSYFSGDCDIPMEEMILSGISHGLTEMCFTEHNDFDFPAIADLKPDTFFLNVDSYLYELLSLKEKYQKQIRISFGVEIGVQEVCLDKNIALSHAYPFDFIIASSHLCQGQDPYYPSFWEGKDVTDCYHTYFQQILANAAGFSDFDVYGHLDYIARYAPAQSARFLYADYQDVIDEILKLLIAKGKGIECNTSGLRKPLNATNPSPDILKRYRELGGEIITVGSDAHKPEDVGYGFDFVAKLLKDCGFDYYTTYAERKPFFHPL
jgi:histidinol-phosphatase (PHP family)